MSHFQVVATDEHGDVLLRFDITQVPISIGRGADNDLVLRNRSVSTRHAKIEDRNGTWRLIDTGSTNGLLVDEDRVHEVDLRDGLRVHIGQVNLEFEELASAHEPTMLIERQSFTRPRSPGREMRFLGAALLCLFVAKGIASQWTAITELADPESWPSLVFETASLALVASATGTMFSLVSKITAKRFQMPRLISICFFVAAFAVIAPVLERMLDYIPNNSWREFISRSAVALFVFCSAFALSHQIWARLHYVRHLIAAGVAASLVLAFSYRDTFIPQKSEVIYPRNLAIPYPLSLPGASTPPGADVAKVLKTMDQLFSDADEDRKDRSEINVRVEANREKM